MRGGVVHVGGEPNGIAHASMFDERQQVGDLQFAAERRTVVALGHGFDARVLDRVVDHQQADRHVGGDDLPGRA